MTGAPATVRPFGDAAFLVALDGLAESRALAAAIGRARRDRTAPPGIAEVVVGFDSVIVSSDPAAAGDEIAAWLVALASRPSAGTYPADDDAARTVTVPVEFDGPDLADVAAGTGGTPDSVATLLTSSALEVALLGFAPGFPYLTGLPSPLAAVPRRATPRPSVAAGSVAVGGGFATVYPRSSPGGWMVLGHTSTRLFDPDHPPYALLRPRDRLRFSVAPPGTVPSGPGEPAGPHGGHPTRPPLVARGKRMVEVVEPGLLSLVEDIGRHGVAALGVPTAGPADPESMRLANALVGNAVGAACLEVTARGPALRFGHEGHAAVVASIADGVEVDLDGRSVGPDVVLPVQAGQVLTVGRVRAGLRAYVALSGGIATPPAVGSRSSDQLSGLGPGPLRAGDQLELGVPVRPHGVLSRPSESTRSTGPVRVVLGPHPFPPPAVVELCSARWTVGADSNRIGLRLRADRPLETEPPSVTSTGMVTGAVQLPPDGNPIVLLVDHATMGGYPVIACVISADLPRLGQARPGDRLDFAAVDAAEARRAYRRRARALDASVSGWFPTTAAT